MTQSHITWLPENEVPTLSPESFESIMSKTLPSLLAIKSYDLYQFFFERLYQIISSGKVAPINRFYGLYLIFKLLEKTNDIFAYQLALNKNLIPYIQETAQYQANLKIANDVRGYSFFSECPSKPKARMGVNFVRLSLELLVFLQRKYASAASAEPWKNFFFENKAFQQKIKQSSYYHFVDRDYVLSENLAIWNYSRELPAQNVETRKIEKVPEPICLKLHNDHDADEVDDQLAGISNEYDEIILGNKQLNLNPITERVFRKRDSPKSCRSDSKKLLEKWKQEENDEGSNIVFTTNKQEHDCYDSSDKEKNTNLDNHLKDSNEENQEIRNAVLTDINSKCEGSLENENSALKNCSNQIQDYAKPSAPAEEKAQKLLNKSKFSTEESSSSQKCSASPSKSAEKIQPKVVLEEYLPSKEVSNSLESRKTSPIQSPNKKQSSFSTQPVPKQSFASSESCKPSAPAEEKAEKLSNKSKFSTEESSSSQKCSTSPSKSAEQIQPKVVLEEYLPSKDVANSFESRKTLPIQSPHKKQSSFANKPEYKLLNGESFALSESCQKSAYYNPPASFPSEKARSTFSSPKNNKIAAELLQISKSIERSKVYTYGFSSSVNFKNEKQENLNQEPDFKDTKTISSIQIASPKTCETAFSSIFSEKNEMPTNRASDKFFSRSRTAVHEIISQVPDPKFTRPAPKSKTLITFLNDNEIYSSNVFASNEERNEMKMNIKGYKAFNPYSHYELRPKKDKVDPFSRIKALNK